MIAYVTALILLVGFDAAWLSLMAKRLYQPRIGHLMAERFSLTPAVLFYPLYAFGLFTFVLRPALQSQQNLWPVFCSAALYGLIAYAAYDLTNQATLKAWPWSMTVIDMAWGSLVSGVVCVLAVVLVRFLR